MRFSQEEREQEVFVEPRSVLVMEEEARWKWKHEIPARSLDIVNGLEMPRSRRVSLTFRIMPDMAKSAQVGMD
jgi:alkylated DNA repair dioxygenase AlkB